eukprot:gene7997-13905_t
MSVLAVDERTDGRCYVMEKDLSSGVRGTSGRLSWMRLGVGFRLVGAWQRRVERERLAIVMRDHPTTIEWQEEVDADDRMVLNAWADSLVGQRREGRETKANTRK